jgi:hypothetical protein
MKGAVRKAQVVEAALASEEPRVLDPPDALPDPEGVARRLGGLAIGVNATWRP